jgi:hypothetical protein
LILQDRRREFLAATGLTHAAFARVLPAFARAYAGLYPPDKTFDGQGCQRQGGGGANGALPQREDKLFFLLVYQKTHPLQTMHGLPCQLRQPPPHSWMHRLLPVLPRALAAFGVAPERAARRVATSPRRLEGAPMWPLMARSAVANALRRPAHKRHMTAARSKRSRIKLCCW